MGVFTVSQKLHPRFLKERKERSHKVTSNGTGGALDFIDGFFPLCSHMKGFRAGNKCFVCCCFKTPGSVLFLVPEKKCISTGWIKSWLFAKARCDLFEGLEHFNCGLCFGLRNKLPNGSEIIVNKSFLFYVL